MTTKHLIRIIGRDLTRRFARIKHEFPLGITLFCEIVMFFSGIALILDPWLPALPNGSPWHRWGNTGEVTIGVIFFLLGTYGALFRERQTGLIPTFLLTTLGLFFSFHPFNAIGFVLYLSFLIGGVAEAHERRIRSRLRREQEARGRA